MCAAASADPPGTNASDDLEPLVERLARWQYAASGDGLTSWEGLPENERARSRSLARQTLRAIGGAGYSIQKAPEAVERAPAESALDSEVPDENLSECCEMAERFLQSGDPLLAYNVTQQRPGSDIFVVYRQSWDRSGFRGPLVQDRRFIVKFTYLFQR
jgi:hypothetical protein